MARLKLQLPQQFPFVTTIPVRITDLNYGAHVGNDTILTLIHEARVQYLAAVGYTELDFAGVGLIMSDVAIEFKSQLYYGTFLKAHIAAAEFTRAGFELYYKLTTETAGTETIIAQAKTGMVCYDYGLQKVVAVPQAAVTKLQES
ncbi:MAG TPA: thioesterase family protein [Chitinophagaceae bacterium]|nr:thioesterase family protein [Chitinophagaceae bacterium]